MSLSSKHTVVQFCCEGAKQLPLTNAPGGWAAQYGMTKAREVSPEVFGAVHKQVDDIKGLPE
jgi:hypothetical protein